MTEKINITDIDKLKITKVKTYVINFTYDNVKYFIKDDSEEDAHISLYRRVPTGEFTFKNEHINGKITCMSLSQFIKDISKKNPHTLTYSNLDKEHFVKKLVSLGFSSGLFTNEYNQFSDKLKKLEDAKKEIDKQISSLKQEWNMTHNHGSKTCSKQHKLKLCACERVKGSKDGDYSKHFKAHYGSTHSLYGGVLTDLFNLKYGTIIHVENGNYYATIGYNEKGNKTIVTDAGEFELTKDYHSAYITIIEQ